MKRTVTEIFIEVEETVAVRLHKQNSPAVENDNRETTEEMIACPFCGGAFSSAANLENQNEQEKQNK